MINQTADSVSVNVKLAQFLGMPHIGSYNHELHNQVEEMIESDPNLKSKASLVQYVLFILPYFLKNDFTLCKFYQTGQQGYDIRQQFDKCSNSKEGDASKNRGI